MNPLVSILIPAYNAERWIAATLRSALAQTWPRTEIIVVDDGSRDQTFSIAQKFSAANVKVVTQKNSGASAARNHAFRLCQGDFIQWLDADDLLAPDKIARQMEVAGKISDKRVLFSSGWGRFMFRVSRAKFIPSPLWEDLSPAEWMVRKQAQNLFLPPIVWLASRELTEAAGPWDERLSLDDDGEYFCRLLLHASRIQFVPEAKSFYRVSGSGSLSNVDWSDKKMDSLWLSLRRQIQYLRALEDTARTRAAGAVFLRNWLPNFYPARPDIVDEAKKLAAELGAVLENPRLRPKYAWLENFFGARFASRAQHALPNGKTAVLRAWDCALSKFGG